MKIISDTILLSELVEMAPRYFGDLVKAVVDVDRELLAVDSELHSDLEAALLNDGSQQQSLWGINFYPEADDDDFVEFDSMINIRPSQGNRSRGVDDQRTRDRIIEIVGKRVVK